MERQQLIQTLVSQFEEQIRKLSEHKLKVLGSGKLEISLTPVVGREAGGVIGPVKSPIPSGPATAPAASRAKKLDAAKKY